MKPNKASFKYVELNNDYTAIYRSTLFETDQFIGHVWENHHPIACAGKWRWQVISETPEDYRFESKFDLAAEVSGKAASKEDAKQLTELAATHMLECLESLLRIKTWDGSILPIPAVPPQWR